MFIIKQTNVDRDQIYARMANIEMGREYFEITKSGINVIDSNTCPIVIDKGGVMISVKLIEAYFVVDNTISNLCDFAEQLKNGYLSFLNHYGIDPLADYAFYVSTGGRFIKNPNMIVKSNQRCTILEEPYKNNTQRMFRVGLPDYIIGTQARFYWAIVPLRDYRTKNTQGQYGIFYDMRDILKCENLSTIAKNIKRSDFRLYDNINKLPVTVSKYRPFYGLYHNYKNLTDMIALPCKNINYTEIEDWQNNDKCHECDKRIYGYGYTDINKNSAVCAACVYEFVDLSNAHKWYQFESPYTIDDALATVDPVMRPLYARLAECDYIEQHTSVYDDCIIITDKVAHFLFSYIGDAHTDKPIYQVT